MAPGAAKVEAERQLAFSKQEIEDEKKALTELEAIQSRYKQSAESMRTKIRKLKEEMSGMVEGTDEYYRKMRELGTLQDRYGDISKQGQIFADDQKNIRATTEVIQGLSGVMSAGTGVATLFGARPGKSRQNPGSAPGSDGYLYRREPGGPGGQQR